MTKTDIYAIIFGVGLITALLITKHKNEKSAEVPESTLEVGMPKSSDKVILTKGR